MLAEERTNLQSVVNAPVGRLITKLALSSVVLRYLENACHRQKGLGMKFRKILDG